MDNCSDYANTRGWGDEVMRGELGGREGKREGGREREGGYHSEETKSEAYMTDGRCLQHMCRWSLHHVTMVTHCTMKQHLFSSVQYPYQWAAVVMKVVQYELVVHQ